MEPLNTQAPAAGSSRVWWAIAIIAILAVGGVVWYAMQDGYAPKNSDLSSETPEAGSDQGSSDEVSDIEADLEATTFEGIDAELPALENEVQ